MNPLTPDPSPQRERGRGGSFSPRPRFGGEGSGVRGCFLVPHTNPLTPDPSPPRSGGEGRKSNGGSITPWGQNIFGIDGLFQSSGQTPEGSSRIDHAVHVIDPETVRKPTSPAASLQKLPVTLPGTSSLLLAFPVKQQRNGAVEAPLGQRGKRDQRLQAVPGTHGTDAFDILPDRLRHHRHQRRIPNQSTTVPCRVQTLGTGRT